jgi:hypothetical protein
MPDMGAVKFRQLDYRYQVTDPVPLVQVLKSLQCWLYQRREGVVPKTELYKFKVLRGFVLYNGLMVATPPLYSMHSPSIHSPRRYAEANWRLNDGSRGQARRLH